MAIIGAYAGAYRTRSIQDSPLVRLHEGIFDQIVFWTATGDPDKREPVRNVIHLMSTCCNLNNRSFEGTADKVINDAYEENDALRRIWNCLIFRKLVNVKHYPKTFFEITKKWETKRVTSQLRNIYSLNLSGLDLKRLPLQFLKFTNLKELYLERNSFTEIPEVLERMPQLRFISLNYTCIKVFPPMLGNLPLIPETSKEDAFNELCTEVDDQTIGIGWNTLLNLIQSELGAKLP